MSRSLNKVTLIGNLTRDPELRYTPQGSAVCTFGVATNRQWVSESGERKEDVEFHRIVSWQKLAELCAQLLSKGRKVYVEGRLQTRKWQTKEGQDRTTTEVVINEMILLDSRGSAPDDSVEQGDDFDIPEDIMEEKDEDIKDKKSTKSKSKKKSSKKKSSKKSKSKGKSKDEEDEDIPF